MSIKLGKLSTIKTKICIVGLGYVGLPIALSFSKKFKTFGYDVNSDKIGQLKNRIDSYGIVDEKDKKKLQKIEFTNDLKQASDCDIFIICVPTPLTKSNKPNLYALKNACLKVGKVIKKNSVVVIESTVYPGTTDEICIPILEKHSKKKINSFFSCAYSPERINPGDKINNFENINKIVSASNKECLDYIAKIYQNVIKAKIILVSSIKIAEASKIIENTQRDINIGLINEFSLICKKMNIDVHETLKASATKWNFLDFKPGFVGGHCISVDPYYLAYKAKKVGINPKIILAARKLNNSIPQHVINDIEINLKNKKIPKKNKKINILIMGITYKKNTSDFRNSGALELAKKINLKYNLDVYDPFCLQLSRKKINEIKNLKILDKPKKFYYDLIIIAVTHDLFKSTGLNNIKKYLNANGSLIDLWNLFPKSN